eukprot:685239-Pyramimonas_sp.AAC.1
MRGGSGGSGSDLLPMRLRVAEILEVAGLLGLASAARPMSAFPSKAAAVAGVRAKVLTARQKETAKWGESTI